jgi:hypothetical protein
MKTRRASFPTSCRRHRALPAVRLSSSLRRGSQSLMLVQIFVNAARSSASNERSMRGLPKTSPPLVSAQVGKEPGTGGVIRSG